MTDLPLLKIAWTEPLVPPVRAEAFERRVTAFCGGAPLESVRPMAWAPWRAELSVAPMVRPCNHLDDGFMALAVLVDARAHSCRYCHGALTATLRVAGIKDAVLLQLDERLEGVDLPARERAGLTFVRSGGGRPCGGACSVPCSRAGSSCSSASSRTGRSPRTSSLGPSAPCSPRLAAAPRHA